MEYHFFSTEEFRELIEKDSFVEYEEVYPGRFYGTLKSEVERIWNKDHVIIFDVDVKGGVNLKKYFGETALSVFIQAPSVEVLRERLIGRGTDSMEEIAENVDRLYVMKDGTLGISENDMFVEPATMSLPVVSESSGDSVSSESNEEENYFFD